MDGGGAEAAELMDTVGALVCLWKRSIADMLNVSRTRTVAGE
jgi:hypothetical protein